MVNSRKLEKALLLKPIFIAMIMTAVLMVNFHQECHSTTIPKPNILIYLIDTVRRDHVGCYGYFRKTTPCIDEFAKDAILFENALAQSSWTRPSVASLFTGKFCSSHGVFDRVDILPMEHKTLAESLKGVGYNTHAFMTNLNLYTFFGFARGFDKFVEFDGSFVRDGEKHYTVAKVVHDEVYQYLDKLDDKPFFMYVHTMDPHYPYLPDAPFDKMFTETGSYIDENGRSWPRDVDVNAYDGEIAYGDYHFGELMKRLKSKNLYDNTLIIFLSDHGEELGDHGGWGHGYTLYEELVRIPFIMKLPAQQYAGRRISPHIRILDVYPTLCEMLKIHQNWHTDGQGFNALIQDLKNFKWDPLLYAEEIHDSYTLRSLIVDNYKIIHQSTPKNKMYYFNLSEDLEERNNLTSTAFEQYRAARSTLDMITSSLKKGIFIEIINGRFLKANHTISGYIKIIGDTQSLNVETYNTKEDKAIVFDEKEKTIRFDLNLVNRPNFFGPPDVIIDTRRFRISPPSNPEAKLEISVQLDGRDLPIQCVKFGKNEKVEEKDSFPVEINMSDKKLLINPSHAPESPSEVDLPIVHIYTVQAPVASKATLSDDQKNILRSFGYIH